MRAPDAGGAPSAPLATEAGLTTERERARRDQYAKELDFRGKMLADHDHEPVDGSWSSREADQIRHDLGTRIDGNDATIKSVDCRSKTCSTTLTFPSAADGLIRYLGFLGKPKCAAR